MLIPALAVLAPLLARLIRPAVRVPIVVFELVLGILAGPAVLGWVQPGAVTSALADLGLAMLFFVAGSEIDFAGLGTRSLGRAALGWVLSLVAGIGVGFLLAPGDGVMVVGIALSSTALGTLMPILRDAGELPTPFGKAVIAIGAVGEFLPLVAISVFLSTRTRGPRRSCCSALWRSPGSRSSWRSARRTAGCSAWCARRCAPPSSSECASCCCW